MNRRFVRRVRRWMHKRRKTIPLRGQCTSFAGEISVYVVFRSAEKEKPSLARADGDGENRFIAVIGAFDGMKLTCAGIGGSTFGEVSRNGDGVGVVTAVHVRKIDDAYTVLGHTAMGEQHGIVLRRCDRAADRGQM